MAGLFERTIGMMTAAVFRRRKPKYLLIGLAVAGVAALLEPKAVLGLLQSANNHAARYLAVFEPGQAIRSYKDLIHSDRVIGGRCLHYRVVASDQEKALLEKPTLCFPRSIVFVGPVAGIHAFLLVLWQTLTSSQAVGLILSLAGTVVGVLFLLLISAHLVPQQNPALRQKAKLKGGGDAKSDSTAPNTIRASTSMEGRARLIAASALIVAMPVVFFAATALTKLALLQLSALVGQLLAAILVGIVYYASVIKLLAVTWAAVGHADKAAKLLEPEPDSQDRPAKRHTLGEDIDPRK